MPDGHKGWHSRGYLPHFDSAETVQHIVFRTLNSIPAALLRQFPPDPVKRRMQIDAYLDTQVLERPLADVRRAMIVEKSLKRFNTTHYRLTAWRIMPNHVHVLIEQGESYSLGAIVKKWKMISAHEINVAFGIVGRFWAIDYFDRFIRNEAHFEQARSYIENNPVKAGLVAEPKLWRFSSAWEAIGTPASESANL